MTVLMDRDRRRSRFLFDWSARWAIERNSLDAITGQAATFTRASIGSSVGSDGRVQLAAHSQPRYDWTDLDGDTVRETPAIMTEGARTNLVQQSNALATSPWTATAGAPTNNAGTYAGLPFSLIPSANTNLVKQDVTLTGNTAKGMSFYIRANGTVSGTVFCGLWDNTSSAWRALIGVSISGAGVVTVPTVTAGALLSVESLADGVYRITLQSTAVTAAHTHHVYACNGGAGGTAVSVLMSGLHVEDVEWPSSTIQTVGSTLTRAADSLFFAFNGLPQAMTVYAKFRFRPGTAVISPGVLYLINAAASGPYLALRADSASTWLRGFTYNGATLTEVTATTGAPDFDAPVEARVTLSADGALHLYASIAGGAEVDYGAAAAVGLASAWGTPTLLYVGGHPIIPFASPVIAVRIAAGAQSLAFMRGG